jgi:hypothetical protein
MSVLRFLVDGAHTWLKKKQFLKNLEVSALLNTAPSWTAPGQFIVQKTIQRDIQIVGMSHAFPALCSH